MAELQGVLCATITPFLSNVGPVDYDWIEPHLRFLEANGVSGIVPLGTTGEAASLGLGERERVLDLVLSQRGNLSVMAGTGCASLTETIVLSRYALEQGADAVLVVPPFYFKNLPDSGMLDYFRALCDALQGDAKLVLYHIPRNSGVPINATIIEGLLESHSRQFYGIKDSGGDAEHTESLIQRFPQIKIYSGSDGHVASSVAAGATGVISALANIFPALVAEVYSASGADAGAAQQRLATARSLSKTHATPTALKAMLPWTTGLTTTSVRAPMVNLTREQATALKDSMEEAGLIA